MSRPPRESGDGTELTPRWARWLVARLAAHERAEELIGDLEEVHRERLERRGRVLASVLTGLEALDLAAALLRDRARRRRAARAWRVPTASWLDFKLGLRMLARHPSLTAVAVLAMAFGIATGAGAFQLVKDLILLPTLPYAAEERIVRLQQRSTATTRTTSPTLGDYLEWRTELRSVGQLSALSLRDRNLSPYEGSSVPVAEASVSASAFGLLRVPPLLGRALIPADEAPDAPPVAVLGHQLWQERFTGDPGVIGRVVRLGGERTTVVGVMPAHFAFFLPRQGFTIPAPQDLWVPLRHRPSGLAPSEGPAVEVFGLLAPDATPELARAELATVAARAAADGADEHDRLEPVVRSFSQPPDGEAAVAPAGVLALSGTFLVALMVVMCANVALLLYARAAAREGELAVRSALGASRGRIVAQLFAEALVLAGVAIVVGLAGASVGLRWVMDVLGALMHAAGRSMPSWVDGTLSPATIGYAVGLAVVGAAVAGILPGLKVTGRRPQASLQRLAGRGSGARLGGVWTGVVVMQVTLTVMLVPIAVVLGLRTWEMRTAERGLPSAEYLSAQLAMDGRAEFAAGAGGPGATGDAEALARYEEGYRALERRLAAEPRITAVTVTTQAPGSWHPRPAVQLDAAADPARGPWADRAQVASVDPDFFDVMRTPVVAGRGFGEADVGADQRAVVVNESFVRELLGGRNAIGQRVRYRDAGSPDGGGPWYTIVGVVRDLAMNVDPTLPHAAGIYHPLRPGESPSVSVVVRVAGEPWAFTGRLHELVAEVAPELRLHRALPIDGSAQGLLVAYDAWFRVIVLAGVVALLLTNAGIYAVLAFTVSRRTREIGIRIALGADRRRIVAAILSRTTRHVGVGVLVGAALGSLATVAIAEGAWRPSALQVGGLLAVYMAAMTAACLLACIVPTRQALRIEPTEALAADG